MWVQHGECAHINDLPDGMEAAVPQRGLHVSKCSVVYCSRVQRMHQGYAQVNFAKNGTEHLKWRGRE
jgi:hypothetical protein